MLTYRFYTLSKPVSPDKFNYNAQYYLLFHSNDINFDINFETHDFVERE